ncbi:MAG: lysophospholipid acyltransferase family protein [Dysgonamonadaceae bacterium]|jgi:KDO2-lipid IV(A) lauroyltransferase|nr:lysophospholipid acyltransferase family protein [Dysgonamonadaceae bacterium]
MKKKGDFQYYLLKAVWILLSLMPLRIMYLLSDGLYYLLYYALRYRRPVTRKNLLESFPEKNETEIEWIEKHFYRFLVDTFFETCKLATLSQKQIRKRMKFNNVAEVNADLNSGKSVSLYVGHYGSWEWYSSMTLYFPPETIRGQVYQALHNPVVNRLMLENRNRLGVDTVEMHNTLRWIRENISREKVSFMGYIADQSPSRHQIQYYTRFLNHTVPALTGTEKITKKYDFAAFYLDIKRIKRGYYEATFVRMHENPQSLPDFQLTDIFYQYLEKNIRRQPELYLWTHKRFKFAK